MQMHSCIVGFEKVPVCVLLSIKSRGPLCGGSPRGVLLRSSLSCLVMVASSGEIVLVNSAPYPVQFHVHGLDEFACNVVGYHSVGGCVVGLHQPGRLFVSHCLKGVMCRDGLPAVDEESSQFRFRSVGHYCFDVLGMVTTAPLFAGMGELFDMKNSRRPGFLLLILIDRRRCCGLTKPCLRCCTL